MTDQRSDKSSGLLKRLSADAHEGQGKAALLLAESVLHGLVARSLITVGDAIEMVEIAVGNEVNEVNEAFDRSPEERSETKALAYLRGIRKSLSYNVSAGTGSRSSLH